MSLRTSLRFHPFILKLTAALSLAGATRAPAGQPAAQPVERNHAITVDDYFSLALINDCFVSPDGKLVAYTDSRWTTADEGRNTDVWVAEIETGKTTRLTFDPGNDASPHWSWDSKYIYFTSAPKRLGEKDPPYDGTTQVWRVRVNGDDLQAVTRVKGGIEAFDLSRDTGTLYYTVNSEFTDAEFRALKSKFKSLSYGHGVDQRTEVWKIDLNTWRSEKVCEPKRFIRGFTVSPDGRRIAMHTTPTSQLISNEGWSQIDVYDVRAQQMATLPDDLYRKGVASPYGWIESLAWSADSSKLGFNVSWDGYPSELFCAQWSGEKTDVRKLDRGGVYVVGSLQWRGDQNQLCFLGADHARTRIYAVDLAANDKSTPAAALTPGDMVISGYSFGEKGTLPIVLAGNLNAPPEIYRATIGAHKFDYARITNANPQVASWKLPKISIVSWKSKDGTMCEGILELPPDYEPGSKSLPLVVEIHGGPTDASPFSFQFTIYGRTLMASKGYALFSPNYRGSTGYGDKFLTDLIGHEDDIDVADILSGVDSLVERGVADPQRMAVMGWSNGGFLTNCIITSDTRFKAASSGAGVVDQFIQWAAEDTPGHVLNYMQGFMWDKPQEYAKGSPSARLNQIKTPTLIHVGEKDQRVPPAHARALHRALHQYLNVPCELVVYPGEGHGLSKYRHRQAKMEWDLAWYEKYLAPKSKDKTDTAVEKPETN